MNIAANLHQEVFKCHLKRISFRQDKAMVDHCHTPSRNHMGGWCNDGNDTRFVYFHEGSTDILVGS